MAFAAELLVDEPTPGGNNCNRSPLMVQPPRQDVPPPSPPPPPPPPPPMEVSDDEGEGEGGGQKEQEMRARDSPSDDPEAALTPRSSPIGVRSCESVETMTHLNLGSPLLEAELLYQSSFLSEPMNRSPPTIEAHPSRSSICTINPRRNSQTRAASPQAANAIRPGLRSPVRSRREASGYSSTSKDTSNNSLTQAREKCSLTNPHQVQGSNRKTRQSRGLQPPNRQTPRVQFTVEGGREPVSAQGQKGMTNSLGFSKKISREMQRHLRQKVQLAIEMWRQRMNKKPTPMPRLGDYHQPASEEGAATARPTPRQSPKRPRFSSLGRAGNLIGDSNATSATDRPVSAEGPTRGRMMEPTYNRSRLGSNSRSPSISATRKSSVARHDCHSKAFNHPSQPQENKKGSTGGSTTMTGKRRERIGRRRSKADGVRSSSSGEGETPMSSSRSGLTSPPSSASKRGQSLGNTSSRSKSKIPRLVDEKPKKGGATPRLAEQSIGRNNRQEINMQQQSLPLIRDNRFDRGHSNTAVSPLEGLTKPVAEHTDAQKTKEWANSHVPNSPHESGIGDDEDFYYDEEGLLYEEEGDTALDTGYRGDEEAVDEEDEEEEDVARELQADIVRELQAVTQPKHRTQKPNSRSMPVTSSVTTPPQSTAVTAIAFVQQPQLVGSAGDSQVSGSKGAKVSSRGKSNIVEAKNSRTAARHAPPAEPAPSPELDVSQLVASGKAKVCAWVGEWTHPVGRRIGILLPADAVYPPGAPKPLLLQTMVDMELSGVSEETRNDIIRKRQRQEVYALNRIMTSLEFSQFENFCRTHNIPLSI